MDRSKLIDELHELGRRHESFGLTTASARSPDWPDLVIVGDDTGMRRRGAWSWGRLLVTNRPPTIVKDLWCQCDGRLWQCFFYSDPEVPSGVPADASWNDGFGAVYRLVQRSAANCDAVSRGLPRGDAEAWLSRLVNAALIRVPRETIELDPWTAPLVSPKSIRPAEYPLETFDVVRIGNPFTAFEWLLTLPVDAPPTNDVARPTEADEAISELVNRLKPRERSVWTAATTDFMSARDISNATAAAGKRINEDSVRRAMSTLKKLGLIENDVNGHQYRRCSTTRSIT